MKISPSKDGLPPRLNYTVHRTIIWRPWALCELPGDPQQGQEKLHGHTGEGEVGRHFMEFLGPILEPLKIVLENAKMTLENRKRYS